MIGYSKKLAETNAEADGKMLGVRLGKLCIKQGISVIEIATHLKVSRTAVYNWFTGLNEISSRYELEVKKLIERLKKA